MSRRAQIAMTEAEVLDYLEAQRTIICATSGPDGWPHVTPLWYVLRDGRVWAWTYARSQKARNLERDPRATLQAEDGESYQQLRGLLLRTTVTVLRDVDTVLVLGAEIYRRYLGAHLPAEVQEMIGNQAPKRVGLEFVETGPGATWDHGKLAAGVY